MNKLLLNKDFFRFKDRTGTSFTTLKTAVPYFLDSTPPVFISTFSQWTRAGFINELQFSYVLVGLLITQPARTRGSFPRVCDRSRKKCQIVFLLRTWG